MAFLDLTVGTSVPARQESIPAAAAVESPPLGAQERRVVLLSRIDPLSSLRPRGGCARLAAALFGFGAPRRLADPRLEALRRYAVLYRVESEELAEERERARLAGLSDDELRHARAMLDRVRGASRKPALAGPAVLLLALAGLSALAVGMLARWVDSRAMAMVLTGLVLVSIIPLVAARSAGGNSRSG